MTRVFPRGVVDAPGLLAVVHDREGTLTALDPRTGRVAWRAGHRLRPCALIGGTVVAVRIAAPGEAIGARGTIGARGETGDRDGMGARGEMGARDEAGARDAAGARGDMSALGAVGASGEEAVPLVVVLLDARDGDERWTSEPVPLPPWARPALDDTDAFTLTADDGDDHVVLHWTARTSYRGGAAPGPGRLAAARREASGAFRVDLAGRPAVTPLPEPPPLLAFAERTAGTARVGDLVVELAVRPGPASGTDVVLRGTDPHTDVPMWELVLDETPPPRAPPLRP